MLFVLSFLLVFVSSTTIVLSETISLNFESLPTNQGWEYIAHGNSASETDVFSVENNTLHQNSLEVDPSQGSINRYRLNNIINDTLPFTISITARVLQESTDYPFGFSFGFFFIKSEENIYRGIGIGIGTNILKDTNLNTISTSIDNTEFHNFHIEIDPQVGYLFYVDEALM